MTRQAYLVSILTLLLTVGAARCNLSAQPGDSAPAPGALPSPTGQFRVGRVTLHLTDRSRQERVPPGGGVRELMVDVWYPAERLDGPAAAYVASAAFSTPRSTEAMRSYLGGLFEFVKAGRVGTHAVQGAAFARAAGPSPVLLFSHGGGEARETYAVQLLELASHGYAVAAITHTFDSVLAVFPDGRSAPMVPDRWPAPATSAIPRLPPSEEASADRLAWWARDVQFVLDELAHLNGLPLSAPFAGHLDLARAGAFGHSAGGQAAAHACQVEPRLRACVNQDGLSAMAPYYLDERGWGMNQAFMLIVRAARPDPPTDHELAQMNLTRAEGEALIAQLTQRQGSALRRTGGGSYRVTLNAKATTHGDFGDLPLLRARNVDEAAVRRRVVQIAARFTRAFFDQRLRGIDTPWPDAHETAGLVDRVEEFPAVTPPQPRQ